jgi:hypothetical protein
MQGRNGRKNALRDWGGGVNQRTNALVSSSSRACFPLWRRHSLRDLWYPCKQFRSFSGSDILPTARSAVREEEIYVHEHFVVRHEHIHRNDEIWIERKKDQGEAMLSWSSFAVHSRSKVAVTFLRHMHQSYRGTRERFRICLICWGLMVYKHEICCLFCACPCCLWANEFRAECSGMSAFDLGDMFYFYTPFSSVLPRFFRLISFHFFLLFRSPFNIILSILWSHASSVSQWMGLGLDDRCTDV